MDFFKDIVTKTQNILDNSNAPKKLSKDELLRQEFNLPETEKMVDESTAEITVSTKHLRSRLEKSGSRDGLESYSGRLTLTNNFMLFKDSYDNMACSFTIELLTIQKIQRVSRSYDFAIMLTTTNDVEIIIQFVGIKSQCERFGQSLTKLLKSSTTEVSRMSFFQMTLYSEYLLYKNNCSHLKIEGPPPGGLGWVFKFPGNSQKMNDRLKMKKWFDYFNENGRNFAMVRNIMFYKLVSYGLPNKLRGEIWETSCGSMYLRYFHEEEYNRLLVDYDGKTSLAIEEIEKDLNRSLPEYPAYQHDEGINRLRRVLTAYSWKNPEIGYCQAMNIVTAALLIYMSEEQVFWCLNVLCDRIIPGYYSRTMYGVLLDQKVFEGLLKKTIPMLSDHFAKHDIQLSIVSLPWFLSFYLNSMPLIYAFRIIDMLLLHGSKVLFQVALAILKTNGEQLMNCEDDGECIAVFKDYFTSLDEPEISLVNKDRMRTKFDNLWEVAFREFSVVDDKIVAQYRAKFKGEVFQGIEIFVKRAEIRNLPKTQNLNQEQLSNIYDRFYSVSTKENNSAPNKGSSTMDFESFEVFMSQLVDWVSLENRSDPEQTKFLSRLYMNWANDEDELTLESLVVGLNKLVERDIMNSLSNFIELYDTNKTGKISSEEVLQLAEDLIFITSPWRDGYLFDEITNKAIETEIAKRIFERKKLMKEQGIDTSDDEIKLPSEVRFNENKWRNKQSERYLSSGSNFLKLAFQYAQPEIDNDEPLIDLADESTDTETKNSEKLKHNKALDPSHPTYITASMFRMVILADVTYESFFTNIFWRSFHINEKVNEGNISVANNIRGMFNNFLADGRRVAIEVRKRMDDAAKNGATTTSTTNPNSTSDQQSIFTTKSRSQTLSSYNEDDDDDFGNFVSPGVDILNDVPTGGNDWEVLHTKKELDDERKLIEGMKSTSIS
ncbi:hypothetical protein CANARDRAFT_199619 [[Candida] arabinofermentans NRRL YB-2248]|uniref:Rab-GAP TBC domain-containing protein n=1 Tax=[Candida] arabinofermentans NRRL YB-2248 TaxID=983967 RepID=A0A1E4T026_9ASCO|nr:hypothetical protein CANARDRAFT_199619 [[Candida] arabinofermentans NRRL YB-2248]